MLTTKVVLFTEKNECGPAGLYSLQMLQHWCGDVMPVYTVTHDIFLLSVAWANGVSKSGRPAISYIISNYAKKVQKVMSFIFDSMT